CLPVAHIGGLAVVLRSLVTDTPVEVHDTFDPGAVADAAARGATLVSLVTRALRQIPAERFRAILLGGGLPPPDRPSNAIATYGMTETGSGVVYDRIPLDGLEIAIAADGEIRLRGPMLFRAYRHDPDPFDHGWFPTGDLGRWADDGLIMVDGRRGDVIITGGEKVWPARVEPLLTALDSVAEAALVGRPDPEWGERVVAVVVPAAGAAVPSLEELRAAVTGPLPTWWAPRELVLLDRLPRTTLGKVRREGLLPAEPGPTVSPA
ncbi:MAG: AMP-binding protein, partial [Acidimicrobiia bacterium]|nr:AMP-binding protein [Acidimicrobiia bacterium]